MKKEEYKNKLYDMKKENLTIEKKCEMTQEEIKELEEAIENGIEIAKKGGARFNFQGFAAKNYLDDNY